MRLTRTEEAGALVRDRRRALHIAQVELATRSGITRQLLSRFEQGKSDLPLSVVLELMRELSLSVDVRSREERAGLVEIRMPQIDRVAFRMPRMSTATIQAAQQAMLAALNTSALPATRDASPTSIPDDAKPD